MLSPDPSFATRAVGDALSLVALILATLAAGVCVAGEREPDVYTHEVVSDRVNGIHEDLDTDLAPVQMGPVTVVLTSPSHSVEVFEHQLSLGPASEGIEAGMLWAHYEGQAHLVAVLEVGGLSSEIEDHIELPEQEIMVAGKIEIVREAEGYRVISVESPSHVEIKIESDLAGRLGLLCRGFAVLAMGSVDCEAIDQAMSVVRVPLPEPGEEFFVAADELTEQERDQIEAYLRSRRD